MIAKIHKTQTGEIIVAVCDKELPGRKFEENGKILDLTSEFYNGEEMDEDEIGDLIRNAYSINMVGKRAITLGLKEEVISKENIKYIAGIPYANVTL